MGGMIAPADADFETGEMNWMQWVSSTVEITTAWAKTGTHSMVFTADGSGWPGALIPVYDFVPGATYVFSGWMRGATTSQPIAIGIQWNATDYASIGLNDSTTQDTFFRAVLSIPADAVIDTTQSSAWIEINTNSIAGDQHYFDDFNLEVLVGNAAPRASAPYGEMPYAGTLDDLAPPIDPASDAQAYIYENVTVSLFSSSAVAYLYENVSSSTKPVPDIWYIFPTTAEPQQSVTIVGLGFGVAQSTFSGQVVFDGKNPVPNVWDLVDANSQAYTPASQITPSTGIVDPEHEIVVFVVPDGAHSGNVQISTVT